MNAFLVHFIQKISSYSNHHPATNEPRCSLEEYDIDQSQGFFPSVTHGKLPKSYNTWEEHLATANGRLILGVIEDGDFVETEATRQWREVIDSWPVLSTESLEDDPRLLQRAHAVLAWLVQYYAHSIPTDRPGPIRIPMSLAVPLVRVSEILRMAPILTFADTVLWNAHPRDPCRPLSTDNIYFENTFSGTEDEDNFYKLSASVELRGVEAIQIVHRYLNLDNPQDRTNESGLRSDLVQLKAVLEELTDLMGSVRQAVDPKVFYWQIRPWFNGSGSSGRQRWVYEGVDESTVMDTSGPSAGQSGIIHTIDAFLGVDHRQLRCPIPSVQQHGNVAFMDRMRRYMQGSHRDFLNHIDDIPVAIKKVAMEQSGLREAYNDAVGALKRLRGIHIQVACLYVINMAGSHPPDGLRRRETQRQLDGARGTGGNHVESLLKAGQDATQRAILE